MKNIVFFLLLLLVGCKKDNGPIGTLEFDPAVCLVKDWGGDATVTMTAVNIISAHVVTGSVPAGWTVTLSVEGQRLTATAPAAESSDVEASGTLSVQGLDTRGNTITASLPVAVGRQGRLETDRCMVVSAPRTVYSFDAMRAGDAPIALPTAEVKLIWMTPSGLISSVNFADGRGSFYLPPAKDGSLREGNALVGAYDAAGNLLCHWHIWVTGADLEAEAVTLASGDVIMNRNLGAAANSADDDDARLASYGLYYQWGRPTPFPAPRNFDASTEYDGLIYDYRNYLITTGLSYVDFAQSHDLAYALSHPLHYLLGDAVHGDWAATDSSELWSETSKTANDPCPRGWRVPTASAFATLKLATAPTAGEPSAELRNAYGWILTDGTGSSRFHATGRRSALTGRIQNLNTCAVPQPWSGAYWTASTAGADAAQLGLERTARALYFDLNTEDAALSTVNTDAHYARATGLAIRCAKIK